MKPKDFMKIASKPSYLVDGLFYQGHFIVVGGLWGSGKSWLSDLLAICVASGTPFLGRKVLMRPVMLVDEETSRDLLMDRLCRITEGLKLKEIPPLLDIRSMEGYSLANIPATDALVRSAKELGIGLVILDNLSSMLGSVNENDVAPARIQWNKIKAAVGTLFLIHHFNKEAEKDNETSFTAALRGSGKILDSADTGLSIRKGDHKGFPFAVKVEKERHSLSGDKEWMFNLVSEDETSVVLGNSKYYPELTHDESVLLHFLGGDYKGIHTVDSASKKLNKELSDYTIRKLYAGLLEKGLAEFHMVNGQHKYFYTITSEGEEHNANVM